jgi:glycosyltransferase involved in cell wall biosynthesis
MTNISVSVVIPTFNSASTLAGALKGVREQRGVPGDFELIVSDCGSFDDTREIGRRFGATVLESSKRSPGAARNVGLFHASGDVIVYLDSDMIPIRQWLHEITVPFRNSTSLLVGGRTLSFMPETLAERFMSTMWSESSGILHSDFPFVGSGNMAVRRDAAISIGGWAEDMLSAEDMDFSTRMIRKFGMKLAYAPRALTFHRHRKTDDDLRKQAWAYGQGAAHMYVKYPDILPCNIVTSAKVLGTLAFRSVAPLTSRLGTLFGLTPKQRLWYSYYLRYFSWWFWCGFASMYLNHKYKPAPRAPPFAKTAISPNSSFMQE